MRRHARVRIATAAALFLVVPLGLYSKRYTGTGAEWVNNHLGGVFYVVFWCLAVLLVRPAARPQTIAAWVLAVTCALETLQLWHPAPLERVRETLIGAAVLGASFDPWDFPYYVIGAVVAWAAMEFRISNIE